MLKDLNHDGKREVASSQIVVSGLKDFNHDKECEVDCGIFSIKIGSFFLFQYDGTSRICVWIWLTILLKGPDESHPWQDQRDQNPWGGCLLKSLKATENAQKRLIKNNILSILNFILYVLNITNKYQVISFLLQDLDPP